jgi:hypothetical protein
MEESLKEMADLIRLVTEEGRHVVGAVATAFVCPYTGWCQMSRCNGLWRYLQRAE